MTPLSRWRDRTLVMAATLLFAVLIRPVVNVNDGSRLATVESLVERHTFAIEASSIFTIDKYSYQGHFYSDKPPLLALYAAVPYAVLHTVGITFRRSANVTYALLTLLTTALITAIGLMFLRRTLRRFPIDPGWADVVVLLAGVGTLVLPYSTVFSNHTAAAALLMLGFYFLIRLEEGARHAALAALFTSLAGSIDIAAFVFVPVFGVVVLRRSFRHVLAFAAVAAGVLGIYFSLNWITSGSFVPPPMNTSLWAYDGSNFGEANLTGLARQSSASGLARYSFHMLFGHRGLFSYTPILVFSLIGAYHAFSRRDFRHRFELALMLLGAAVYIASYLLRSVNYGGYCYGVRWYTDLMLLLCVPLGFIGPRIDASTTFRRVFLAVGMASIVIAFIGANKPFTVADEQHPNTFITCLLEPARPVVGSGSSLPKPTLTLVRNVRYAFIWVLALGACWFFQRTMRTTRGPLSGPPPQPSRPEKRMTGAGL